MTFLRSKDIFNIKTRALVLFGIPFMLAILFLGDIVLGSINVIPADVITCTQPTGQQVAGQVKFQNFVDKFSVLTQTPTSFLDFNIYAFNDVKGKDGIGKDYPLLLNINIQNQYTDSVKYRHITSIYSGINIKNLSSISYVRSFKSNELNTEELLTLTPAKGAHFIIFLLPTISSFLLLWMFLILCVSAIIAAVSFWFKFVLTGSPLNDLN